MCHPESVVPTLPLHLLAIDTCGPEGSIALGRLQLGRELALLAETPLAGRTYSSTLVSSIRDLLAAQAIRLSDLAAIVVTSGPGSFTGVRIGLAAAKGLAEPAQIPLIAVSRLDVLASASAGPSAALDAHRHEIFLRLAPPGQPARELLAGAEELAALAPPPQIALCDDPAELLIRAAWPQTEILRLPPPTAAQALRLALPRLLAGQFDDPVLLDGHYLRRSDAEIFGDPLNLRPRT